MSHSAERLEKLKQAVIEKRLQERIKHHAEQNTQQTIPHADRTQPLVLSWSQQRLWFLHQFDSTAVYHIPSGLRLKGQLNLKSLRAALDGIVNRHEILRTRFIEQEGQTVQVIEDKGSGFHLIEHDLRDQAADEQARSINKISLDELKQPFNLTIGPLIRGRLLLLSEDEHILLLTQHHIISDAWSVNILIQELSHLYLADMQGLGAALPPLPIQYADYAVWQRQWLHGQRLQKQFDYWRDQLATAPPLLELPLDRPRPARQSFKGGRLALALAAGLPEKLQDFCQRNGITLFMALLSAWSILLYRLSGQCDFVIGTPVANRTKKEIEGLLGFFVNTLALRVSLDKGVRIADLLKQVKHITTQAYEHQDLPFEKIVEALKPDRSGSYSPIFQTLFSLDNTHHQGGVNLPGLQINAIEPPQSGSHFDLALALTVSEKGIEGYIEYASDLFDSETIERYALYYSNIIETLLAEQDQAVDRIEFLTKTEYQKLLSGFDHICVESPSKQTIHHWFEQVVEKNKNALALGGKEQALSYDELNRRSNRLAHYLIALGVQPDQCVALCTQRGFDTIIGILGVLKSGAAYVPLDPDYPMQRLEFILNDSKPKALLSCLAVQEKLPKTDIPLIAMDDPLIQSELNQQSEQNPDAQVLGVEASNLAYVIYTSGSSGQPKGVMVEHANLVSSTRARINCYTKYERCLQIYSPAFDGSIADIFGTLLSAGSLYLPEFAAYKDPEKLSQAIVDYRITTILCIPSMAKVLIEKLYAKPHRLNRIIVAGEVCPPGMLAAVKSLADDIQLYNEYGPTEGTVWCSQYHYCQDVAGSVPIGRPIENSRLYILDDNLQIVPTGVMGELYIGGTGVSRGYLNQSKLTRERYIQSPFTQDKTDRLYKTGDCVRWLPDGNIEYLGRNDAQVKLRGYRIELGEIEYRLNLHRCIDTCVVRIRTNAFADQRLIAYIILKQGAAGDPGKLRKWLAGRLPEYMIPNAFVILDALPLTPNGKLDVDALPLPDQASVAKQTYVKPQDETELEIAAIWQALLGLPRVGRNDHFFDLGGHSLLAVQLMSRLRKALDVEVAIPELFANPLLSEFATVVKQAQRSEQIKIEKTKRKQDFPASWQQQRLWFLLQLDPAASAAYHIPSSLRLQGELNLKSLSAAFDALIERHEILRTGFEQRDGRVTQMIEAGAGRLKLDIKDLSELDGHDQNTALMRFSKAILSTPLDLRNGPLMKAHLFKLSKDEHILFIMMHHIISDGWSLSILYREIAQLYRADCLNQKNPLPPLSIQYADYADWQQRYFHGDRLQAQQNYWREQLHSAPALLELPTDRVRPAEQSYRGGSVKLVLPHALTLALQDLSRSQGTTLFMTLFSAWSILMSRLSGQKDIVIGTPVANRQQSELEALIGYFVNTLALRVSFFDKPTIVDLLKQVKETALNAYRFQDLPFDQVVEAVQPPRSLSHSPIFQVLFSLNNTPGIETLDLPGLRLSPVIAPQQTTQFDLSLSLSEYEQGISGELEYASDLFDQSTIERFTVYYQTILQGMVDAPLRCVFELPLLEQAELNYILYDYNKTQRSYPDDCTIPRLFEQQVKHTPEAVALQFEQTRLSYAQLNRRANQLAHYLLKQGVKPDDRVAVCMQRSIDMVVALLGVLKAGAAYVPIDPDYPQERIDYMLKDSCPRVLLTQSVFVSSLLELDTDTNETALIVLDKEETQELLQDYTDRNIDANEVGLSAKHLAYVIYTSGSTGLPKGVMNQHSGVVNRLQWAQEEYQLGQDDSVLQKTPFAFDVSVWEFFLPLMTGAKLVMARPQGHQDPAYLHQIIQSAGITTIHFVPSMLKFFLDHLELQQSEWQQEKHNQCVSLQRVLCSGEALSYRLMQRFFSLLPNVELHNLYGPTEAAIDVSAWNCADGVDLATVPIGRPIANTQLYILDEYLQAVPPGVSGEIYIGGAGVARGYLNRPELTQQRFIANPFPAAHDRLYKTGDLARWLPGGVIEFLGRNDFQVKIRGFRIELGEIEARLAELQGVDEVLVLASNQDAQEPRLIAYIASQQALSTQLLREHLAACLPEYMLPSAYIVVKQFPLSANGKIDRAALPAPDWSSVVNGEYVAPFGEAEVLLAKLWSELLNIDRVGRFDHFFELGGHSLLIISLIERLRQQGWYLDVRSVFSAPRLCEMAALLSVDNPHDMRIIPENLLSEDTQTITTDLLPLVELTQSEIDTILADIPGGAANVQDIYPLAPLQEGVLFQHLLNEQAGEYVQRSVFMLAEQAVLDQFLYALREVIARHDILRSSMHWEGITKPVQVVQRRVDLRVNPISLSAEGSPQEQFLTLSNPENASFDLSRAPLLYVFVAQDPVTQEWLLALMHHHLISDHITIELIAMEIRTIMQGRADTLKRPYPYRNFIAQLGAASHEDHVEYFRRRLADVDEPTIPFAVTTVQGKISEQVKYDIPTALGAKLRHHAQAMGVSPAILFHVAWAKVLSQCTDKADVLMGTILSGRAQGSEGADQVLGMFMNTLPLRVSIDDLSVQEIIHATYDNLSELIRHEQAPLSLAQSCSGVHSSLPLFTTLFNYRHSFELASEHQDDAFTTDKIRFLKYDESAHYPILVSVDDFSTRFSLTTLTVEGIKAQQVTAYILQAVREIVLALEHNPDKKLCDINIIDDRETKKVLLDFNDTFKDFSTESGCRTFLHQMFEDAVQHYADEVAVVYQGESISYQALNQRSNQLAHYLRKIGVARGDRVAICLPRNLQMPVCLYAVIKAGATYIPLDPAYPPARIDYILKDSGAAVVLTETSVFNQLSVSVFADFERPVLLLDKENFVDELSQQSESNIDVDKIGLTVEDFVYIIYTSGSTGQPKGVAVYHQGYNNLVHWYASEFDFNRNDRVLIVSSFSFDLTKKNFMVSLMRGGRLYLSEPQFDPESIIKTIESDKITVLNLTPSAFYALIDSDDTGNRLESLRCVFLGGEPINMDLIQPLCSRYPELEVINTYGPTECSDVVAFHRLQNDSHDKRLISPPIGKPISNTQLYLLDSRQKPVPLGAVGEIYIAGAGVAYGYLNRPELNEERFRPNPFDADQYSRMYRTGDLGRLHEDGNIEYLGRNDFQVKIRGFRIELGEIEAQICACPEVQNAVVVADDAQAHQRQLIAYIIFASGYEASGHTISQRLSDKLPDYMIPKQWVVLDAFPLTASGKLNRKALPKPDCSSRSMPDYIAPENDNEMILAALWQAQMGVDRVGREDHFFELGGQSLLVMQLISRLRAEHQLEITIHEVFANPLLKDMACIVRQLDGLSSESIPLADREESLPLSLAQQRLWFLDQLDHAASVAYHLPGGIYLKGVLDRQALQNALNRVVYRHESLRTRFVSYHGEAVQQIEACDIGFTLSYEDLSHLNQKDQQAQVPVISQRETQRAFELDKGPLIRGLLLKLSAEMHILLITQHHIISDGWSIGNLIREISVLYDAFVNGLQDPLPPLRIQYSDYAAWQRAWLQGDRLQQQQNYWKAKLDSAPALLELPIDFPRPATQSYRGGRLTIDLPERLSSALRKMSQRCDVTLYMSLLTAWSVLLARLSGQNDIVVGTPVANRQRKESESLIGFFVNTLALRVELQDNPTVIELLSALKAAVLDAHKHQDIPFEQVVEVVQPQRSLSYSPLFQNMFTLDNIPTPDDLHIPGLTISPLATPHCTTHFDLSLSLSDTDNQISGYFEYASDLFKSSSIQRISAYYLNILEAMVQDQTQSVLTLPWISTDEHKRVLFEFNQTQLAYKDDALLHRLFEIQAVRHPEKNALVFQDDSLSYYELNKRANQIAYHLLAQGAKPDSCVAIFMQRGFDLVTAILAVLKSGAAYVPLDPECPDERLAYQLSDCKPLVLLTQTAYRDRLSELNGKTGGLSCLVLDGEEDLLALSSYPDADIDPNLIGLKADHLAYIIYTSGSTGQPKGVMVEHRQVIQQAVHQRDIKINADDCLAYCANPAFDASSWEIWSALLNGAQLVIVSHDTLLDPVAFGDYLKQKSVNIVQLTAGLFAQYSNKLKDVYSNLKYLLFGGDQTDPAVVKQVYLEAKPEHLIHTYGPTETVTFTVCHEVNDADMSLPRLPIGKAINNTYVYILDEYLQPVPVGVRGELYIGGVGVARGYLNQPMLNEERFIQDPYADNQCSRLYKTGDLGRWRGNGEIEFLGRNDDQVKVRGFRIELGEIETHLTNCVGVADAIVTVNADASGNKTLLAYLIGNKDLSVTQLKRELSQQLPDYMIPGAFTVLPEFPLTANGKVDRKALLKIDHATVLKRQYIEPQGGIEILLANIWKDLLKLERVSRLDHFFELGGHSLLIISLLEKLRVNKLSLDVRSVFVAPILADMAVLIKADIDDKPQVPENLIDEHCVSITPDLLPLVNLTQMEIDSIVASVPGGVANIQDVYPLAPLQEGILFHHLLHMHSDPYLLRSLLSFDRRRNVDQFISSLQRVIDRHDILRSAIHWQGLSEPVQVVQRQARLPVQELVLSETEDSLQQLMALSNPCQHRQDLSRAPLLKLIIGKDQHSEKWHSALLHHHIVSDHVTLDFIIQEIYLMVKGLSDKLPPSLPYRNFIAQARSVPIEQHEDFFKQQLQDIEEPTTLFGINDIQNDGGNIKEADLNLTQSLNKSIRQQAKKHGVSAAVLFHVAWAQVLALCSGRDDVVMGTVLSGRSQGSEGADQVLGMFINTLPLRIKLAGNSVSALIKSVYEDLSDLLVHEQASLALAQRCSGIPASMPLFTSLLNYVHSTAGSENVADSPQEDIGMQLLQSEERTNYPLMLSVNDDYQSFNINAQCIDAIDPERIVNYMRSAISKLVDALQHHPESALNEFDILPSKERERILQGFNCTETRYDDTAQIHRLFEKQAQLYPDKAAVIFKDYCVSYEELNRRANQVAHYLLALNLVDEFRVAVCLERGVDMLVVLLGILKAGGCYIPLDADFPPQRLQYMINDSEPAVLISSSVLIDRLFGKTAIDAKTLRLIIDDKAFNDKLALQAIQNPDADSLGLTSRNLAYIIYTSGSTGQPKGVMVEHGNVLNFLYSMLDQPGMGREDICLAVTTVSFDIAGLELYLPLSCGATIVLSTHHESHDAELLQASIEKHQVTMMQATPATWQMLLDSGWRGHKALKVLSGGEALHGTLALRLCDCTKEVWNLYGPTETTIWSSRYKIMKEAITAETIVSIGSPIANTEIYILGEHRQLLPIGVIGEIYIAGAGVGRGYFKQPELTCERFIQNPYDVNAKLYKTGDLAYWRDDGTIQYVGRNDEQIKLRGFRIEAGEIESALLKLKDISQVLVMLREDKLGDKRLLAYLVSESELNVSELRDYLMQQLPAYMHPSAYIQLPQFPLTENGKIDRSALPMPDRAAVTGDQYIAPQGSLEQRVANIWKEVLRVERVGRMDHFFDLGGHSITAVQLIARLKIHFNVEVPLHELFLHPVLCKFVSVIENAEFRSTKAIGKADRSQAIPLSWSQQRLWFISQLDPAAGIAYHIPAGLRLIGDLNRSALQRSLDAVVRRHEILRTTFVESNGQARQMIGPPEQGFVLLEHDLSDLDAKMHASEIERVVNLEANEAFDLLEGPLIRGRLLKLNSNEFILLLTQHHIISDGWSIGLLVYEISELYKAFCLGYEDPLPELKIQYADFSVWQRDFLQAEALQKQLDYWCEQLRSSPLLSTLPSDHARPPTQSYRGNSIPFKLSTELSTDLKDLSREQGVTLFMLLFAAWSVLISRLSGQNDIVIGSPTANRKHGEIEPLIGFFVNTLALRMSLEDSSSFENFLQQAKQIILDAQQHQDMPFERVVEALKPERSLSHSPIFQILFVFNNTPGNDEICLPGLTLKPVEIKQSTSQFDLTLSLFESDEGIYGEIQYACDLFEKETIERYAGYFKNLLQGVVSNAQQKILRLPLLDADEKETLIAMHSMGETGSSKNKCIHHLFEAQVVKCPSKTALVFLQQKMSYRDLNERSNRLARELIDQGVKLNDFVGLSVDRSFNMIVAIMGILKSGAAYVPLNYRQPTERLRHIIDNAKITHIVIDYEQNQNCEIDVACKIILDDERTQSRIKLKSKGNLALSNQSVYQSVYLLYTSGSTGLPKGVDMPHSAVVNLIQQLGVVHGSLRPGFKWLQYSTVGFDMAFTDIFMSLNAGGELHLIDDETQKDIVSLTEYIMNNKIHCLNLPAVVLNLFIQYAEEKCYYFESLKLIISTAERLKISDDLLNFLKRHQACKLINEYGPTETHVVSSYTLSERDNTNSYPPIGKPLANVQFFILNSELELQPRGAVGELYVGGVCLANGYLNNQLLTQERFIKNPFSNSGINDRLYKTGDLVRYLPDGNVEYIGRADFQVKIRGFRVELGEVESRLLQHHEVSDAVVLLREDQPGEAKLTAYIKIKKSSSVDRQDLRAYLQEYLPDYMLPAFFVFIDEIPITLNGKLDRKALPAPDQSAITTKHYVAPINDLEMAVANIWQDLLGVERVGRDDHFFDLGGHSILAVQMLAAIRSGLGIELALHQIFAAPILKQFIESIDSSKPAILIPFRVQGSQTPIFFIHAGGGGVAYAAEIMPYIDADIPIYGLGAKGFLPGEDPLDSVEQMASLYIEEIRHIQTQGPYRIAGWSFGGIVAYEMAKQLTDAGLQVEFLGLIDAEYRQGLVRLFKDMSMADTILWQLEKDVAHDIKQQLERLAEQGDIERMLMLCQRSGLVPADIDIERLKRHLAVEYHINRAIVSYSSEALSVPAVMFSAKDENHPDPANGWRALLSEHLSIQYITGDHQTLVRQPCVQELGKAIDDALNNSREVCARRNIHKSYDPLLVIQAGDKNITPLFCMPGAGANITVFNELAVAMGPTVPIYGLQAKGLDEFSRPDFDVCSAVDGYIQVVRNVCANTACHLLGHSYGGWLAFELALKLSAVGGSIASLTLLDSNIPASVASGKQRYTRKQTLIKLIELYEMKLGKGLSIDEDKLDKLSYRQQIDLLLTVLIEHKLLSPLTDFYALQRIIEVYEANINTDYLPSGIYPGPLHLINVKQANDKKQAGFIRSWQRYAPNAVYQEAKGNHMTMLSRPHVIDLAEKIKKLCLIRNDIIAREVSDV